MAVSKLIGRQRQARKSGWTKPFTANDDAALLADCKFDLLRATDPIDWIESYCRLPSGPKAGQRVELLPWFRDDLIIPLYGWIKPDGSRRYRQVCVSVAKKNAKSTGCSSLALYGLCGDLNEEGRYIYLAAVSKNQTKNVYHPATEMVLASPRLAKTLKIVESRKEIWNGTNNFIAALAADKGTSQGIDPYMLIRDETHEWLTDKATKFAGSIKYAQRSRRSPIWVDITTRGHEKNSLYGHLEEYAIKIFKDEIIETSFLPLIYAPDENDPIDDPETWKKGNPALGATVSIETLQKEYVQAKAGSPSDLAEFKRYSLNMWQPGESGFLNLDDWADCANADFDIGKPECVHFGVDISSKEDITSYAIVGKTGPKVWAKVRMWAPERKMLELLDKQDSSYRQWADEGHLMLCEGDVIDQDVIFEQMLKDIVIYKPRQIAFDRYNADQLMRKLDKYKKNFVVQIAQNFQAVSEPMKDFKLLTMTKQFVHEDNKCLNWQAGNLCKFDDHLGNVRYVRKGKSGNYYKIDGMVSIILAMSLMKYHVTATSIYNDPSRANPLT